MEYILHRTSYHARVGFRPGHSIGFPTACLSIRKYRAIVSVHSGTNHRIHIGLIKCSRLFMTQDQIIVTKVIRGQSVAAIIFVGACLCAASSATSKRRVQLGGHNTTLFLVNTPYAIFFITIQWSGSHTYNHIFARIGPIHHTRSIARKWHDEGIKSPARRLVGRLCVDSHSYSST